MSHCCPVIDNLSIRAEKKLRWLLTVVLFLDMLRRGEEVGHSEQQPRRSPHDLLCHSGNWMEDPQVDTGPAFAPIEHYVGRGGRPREKTVEINNNFLPGH